MCFFKRMIGRFCRSMRIKGNGVQSPFVFSFVCGVVNNSSAYYAYEDLSNELKRMSRRQKRRAKLLFRLSNFVAPAMIFVDSLLPEVYSSFLQRGSLKSPLKPMEEFLAGDCKSENKAVMLVCDKSVDCDSVLPDGSMIVCLAIRKSSASFENWKILCSKEWATLTFDMFDMGIVIVDSKRFKQHFVI